MRRWLVWVPVSVGLLALLVWRTRPWEAAALAGHLDLAPLAGAVALNLPVVALWAVRSAGLMRAVGYPLSLPRLIPVVSFANTVNNLTPASSGEVLRAVILKRRYGIPYERSTAVILAERFWAILIMLATALAASVGTVVSAGAALVSAAWVGAAALVVLPSVAYKVGLRPGRLAARIASRGGGAQGRLRSIAARLAAVDDQLTTILTSPRLATAFIASTLAIFTLFAAQLWLVLAALGISLSPLGVWAALGLSIIAGVISALPFGLGAADVVLVVLLGAQGMSATDAGAAALLFRLTTTLPLGILGTASWIQLTGGQRVEPEETRSPDEPIPARTP
jgi:uncharacterized protein (TIRG00374 family)